MCGINGIIGLGGAGDVDLLSLRRTRDHMAVRGPDAVGEWVASDRRVAFGHRRLSIIELSDLGAQPMLSEDGTLAVTFNGEIYNYLELRQDLIAAGCKFRSRSDTEVLLHLYQRHGPDMVAKLRGMFGFGLWDARQRRLLLARDPYGIKPLYYSANPREFVFASTVKSLIAGGRVATELDSAGLVGFHLLGSVPDPFTLYRAIRALPAGATLVVEPGKPVPEPRTYYSLARTLRDGESKISSDAAMGSSNEAVRAEALRAALLDSVKAHLVADVPVGAFLSAGVDSSALVGLMRDAGQSQISTITITYDEFKGLPSDEAPLAEAISRHYETQHTTRRVSAEEFREDLPRILAQMDQPSIDGVNTWFVSKAARELGLKVAVSGVGGDELIGGYSTFRTLPQRVARLRQAARVPGLGRLHQSLVGQLRQLGVNVHPKLAGLVAYGGSFPGAYLLQRGLRLPHELDAVLDPDVVRDGLERLQPLELIEAALRPEPATDFGKVAALESGLYLRNQLLRDTDWAGMAHSIEIRTPLVDRVLLERLSELNLAAVGTQGKRLLGQVPMKPVLDAIIEKPKTGFSIPLEHWAGEIVADEPRSVGRRHSGSWSRRWARFIAAEQTGASAFVSARPAGLGLATTTAKATA